MYCWLMMFYYTINYKIISLGDIYNFADILKKPRQIYRTMAKKQTIQLFNEL